MPRLLRFSGFALVALAAVAESGSPEDARPLTEAGRVNLVAFAKAYGFVRFFQPTVAATQVDWNAVAVQGVRNLEGARDPKERVERLRTFFAPLAPTVVFLAPGEMAPPTERPVGATQAVRWCHQGFGQDKSGSPYRSARETAVLGSLPRDWRRPDQPLVRDLGEGVRIQFSPTLYADAHGVTLPSSSVPFHLRTAAGDAGGRAVRLGAVVVAWTIFEHFYPYREEAGVDWAAALPRALAEVSEAADAKAVGAGLQRLCTALRDGHGSVQSPEKLRSGYLPFRLQMLGDRAFVLASKAADVPSGSELLEVDGQSVLDRVARLRPQVPAPTEGWVSACLAWGVHVVRDPSPARIRFRTPAGEMKEAILARLEAREVEPLGLPPAVSRLRDRLWYVDLHRVADADLEALYPSLAEARGVIFDMRGYPRCHSLDVLGHLTDRTLETIRMDVPVVTEPDRSTWTWKAMPGRKPEPLNPRIRGKVAFLTGGGALSAAETCLSIVEAHRLAEIVGEPTGGTNGNVNPFTVPGGFTFHWTGMKVLKPDGSRHFGVGIRPTVPVTPTAKGLAEGRDEVLEKAIEVLSK